MNPQPTFHILHKDNPLSWTLLPEFLSRAIEFCRENDPDGDPDYLYTSIAKDFAEGGQDYCCIVGLVAGKVIGHGLVEIYTHHRKRIATVAQATIDPKSGVEIRAIDGLQDEAVRWATERNCYRIQAFVKPGIRERWLKSLHGYKTYSVCMRKEL